MRTAPAWRPEIKTIRNAKTGARASAESTQRFPSMKMTSGVAPTCAEAARFLEPRKRPVRAGLFGGGGAIGARNGGGWAAGRDRDGAERQQPGQELRGRDGQTAEVDRVGG